MRKTARIVLCAVTLLFTAFFFGCKKEARRVIIWTNKSEFAPYIELFNKTHNTKAVLVYKENPETSFPPDAESLQPDIVISPWLLSDKTKSLPFTRSEIIVSLDPFVGENDLQTLEPKIFAMMEAGIKNFIVNNPAHTSILRNEKVNLIGGAYLYMFNRFAVKWLNENGISKFISPLENSLDNLERTLTEFPPNKKDDALITVFNYPPLFRIRRPLPQTYSFTHLTDKLGAAYRVLSTPSQSFVLPEKPFSITEKIASLQKKGFQKFVIDFSHTAIRKNDYKFIYAACLNSEGISDTSKFNWKEGFYNTEKVENLKRNFVLTQK